MSAAKGAAWLDAAVARHGSSTPENDGALLLDDVRAFISRFCVFPNNHSLDAVTLWAVHAHMPEHFHTTPRLALLSPEPASGKTRVLDVLDLLTPEPLMTISASPAAIFRTLEQRMVTLLFDEVDTIFSKRGKDGDNEDLRGLLNAGYKRGASIPRCVGPKHEVAMFPVFCPVALAGLGELPDTLMSRSIIIKMRRRAPGEQVEPFRTRLHEPEGRKLRSRLASWASGLSAGIGETWPQMPPGIEDRPAECWEPLLMVADAAGGHWPETARAACVSLCRAAEDRRASLGIRLLGDLRRIWGNAEALSTHTILQRLCAGNGLDDDAPWADLRGKPLDSRRLANMLSGYGVKSKKVRGPGNDNVLQGYRRDALFDAWERYLPPVSALPEHPEHVEQASNGAASSRSTSGARSGTSGTVPHVPEPELYPEQGNLDGARVVPDVPDVPLLRGTGRLEDEL